MGTQVGIRESPGPIGYRVVHNATPSTSAERADVSTNARALSVLAAAQFLTAIDFSIVYVALPSIGDAPQTAT